MNILLIGGTGSLMNQMIIKLRKEGHRVYLLTGEQFGVSSYAKVFERYDFSYDNSSLNEIFESVSPDVTLFLGAYDPNFSWQEREHDSVRYVSALMNLLTAYASVRQGRFIYLSSEEVYRGNFDEDITEDIAACGEGLRGMALVQAEYLCDNFREIQALDIVVLRLDHLYGVPKDREQMDRICGSMCVKALEQGYLLADPNITHSLLYESDAIEFIYLFMNNRKTDYSLYHISSSVPVTELQIGEILRRAIGDNIELIEENELLGCRKVLSNQRFIREFGAAVCHLPEDGIRRVADYIVKHKEVFVREEGEAEGFGGSIIRRFGWFFKACVPFVENMACFVPFFMLNNRTVDSRYFSRLDFYLLYVLLFAVIYGQHQAIFSALLAVCGYLFRQMYTRSGFEVMLDYTTYIWMAQLFIVGLVVGYMRDQIRTVRSEGEEIQKSLGRQLRDIKDINSSNVRVKDVLERQVIDQKDSIGKLYSITSTLDQYTPEEVLFYAVEILSKILRSPDVAIYTVYNSDYARLFSSSSDVARKLGNSIRYPEMGELYKSLKERKVYINRQMDERYPLMANAIYDKEEMNMIVMVWGIPWERMTLGQANLLVVISYLIQNAMLRASRYMAALEEKRYVEDTQFLEPEAFSSLVKAYHKAKKKNLTVCTLLQLRTESKDYEQIGKILMKNLRQTDYLGTMGDGNMYVLLANTVRAEADIVISRFAEAGIESKIVEKIEE